MQTKLLSGIYCYSLLGCDKIYIGSSINLVRRNDQHLFLLKNNKHFNKRFQTAFNEANIEMLQYTILKIIDNSEFISKKITKKDFQEKLFKEEQLFLDSFFAQEYLKDPQDIRFFELLFNNSVIAKYTKSEVSLKKEKEVFQFTKEGILINSFYNSEIASICTKVDSASIKKVCYNQRKSAGGFIWSYNNKVTPYENSVNRKIIQYDLHKNFIKEFDSIAQAQKETKIKIRKYNKRSSNTFGGYYFLFENEKFPEFKRKTKYNIS